MDKTWCPFVELLKVTFKKIVQYAMQILLQIEVSDCILKSLATHLSLIRSLTVHPLKKIYFLCLTEILYLRLQESLITCPATSPLMAAI